MKMWIDGDACPNVIKEIIYKAAQRLKIQTYLVANTFLRVPLSDFIHFRQVEKKFDEADGYIIKNLSQHDLVITADIPLADNVIKKNAIALNPRGEQYTSDNISEKLSMRNYLQTLREGRIIQGGAGIFSEKDKQQFAAALDKYTTLIIKQEKHHT